MCPNCNEIVVFSDSYKGSIRTVEVKMQERARSHHA